jgi:tetratricopeptide (TPR) repeat protein
VDVQTVAKELGVRYVLEGSVRKSGNRVRITAQLIDGASGNHLWAERYDRLLEDIFEVQDEITQTVVGAIVPELNRAERERALQTPPENLDAWDYFHRGRWHLYKFAKSENFKAQELFRRAIEIDPSFSQAYAGMADAKFTSYFGAFTATPAEDLMEGFEAAKQAVANDEKDADAHATLGVMHFARREHALAIEALQSALATNPSSAVAHHWLGLVYAFIGRFDEAIAEQDIATKLSPSDPMLWAIMNVRAYAYLNSGRYEQAVEWAHRAIRRPNAPQNPYIAHVVALSHSNCPDEARQAAKTLLERFPDLSIERIRDKTPFNREEDMELWLDGLRKSGVPEK